MATEAQIEANRRNAQHSTGPKTEEGKATSSRNATRFGLFATNACVLPGEEEAHYHMFHILWDELAPVGGLEEVTAGEFIRAVWRLRRCAVAEEQLGDRVVAERAKRDKFSYSGTSTPPTDPILSSQRDTIAINRAVAQAQNAKKRAKAELDKLQAARRARPAEIQMEAAMPEPMPEPEPEPTPEPAPATAPPLAREMEPVARPTQSEPVPQPRVLDFPCTCGSTRPYDKCCGAILHVSTPQRPAA